MAINPDITKFLGRLLEQYEGHRYETGVSDANAGYHRPDLVNDIYQCSKPDGLEVQASISQRFST
jgi:hypothetical protein